MTDNRDQDDRRHGDADRSEAEAAEFTSASRSTQPATGDDTTERDEINLPLTVEETVLATSRTSDDIADPKQLTTAVSTTEPPIGSGGALSVSRNEISITSPIHPSPGVSQQDCMISSRELSVRRITETATSDALSTSPQKTRQHEATLSTRLLDTKRVVEQIEHRTRPTTVLSQARLQGSQSLLDELEDEDPVFAWSGGQPYGDSRPTLIFHYDQDEVPTFNFLERCLRDTYAELEGGEPTVEQVEFVANEPQIPTVSGRIVTLDLTDDGWTPSMSGSRPKIERGGTDLVPALVEQAQSLYSGGLGYLMMNLPAEWEGPVRRAEFFDALIEHITNASTSNGDASEDVGVVEKLTNAPVTVARPKITERELFEARVSQYFGFDRVPEWETISQADATHTNLLRSERWAQVALTERQAYGEESSRHYNWKGLVTDGIARTIWKAEADQEIPFNTFAQKRLRDEDILTTEHPIDAADPDEASAVADIYLGQDSLVSEAVDAFTPQGEYDSPVAFEFETGFSEGAFQYRKMVESVKKYTDHTDFTGSIILLIPPRLLYRGKRQANLLVQLVQQQIKKTEGLSATLCVPVLSDGTCTGVRTADAVIGAIYENE